MKFYFILLLNSFSFLGLSQTAHLVIPKGHLEGVTSVCCSPNGKYIFSGSRDHTAKVWSTHGLEIETFELNHEVLSVAFSPDEKNVAIGCADGKINVFNLNGQLVLKVDAHRNGINSLFFSPNGKSILSGSSDHTAKLWNTNGQLLNTFAHNKAINSVSFSSDGKFILTGSDDSTAVVWDLSGKKLSHLIGHKGSVKHVSLCLDHEFIVTGSDDSTAILWNTHGDALQVIKHPGKVHSCDFSPDNQTIVSGCYEGKVKIWNKSGKILQEFKAHEWGLTSLCFSPNGKAILSGSDDKTMNMFDLNGHVLQHFQGHSHDIHAACFSKDGNFILTGNGDHTAKLWDILNYKYHNFVGHKKRVVSVAASPNGQYLLTGSEDNTAKLWDIHGKELQTFNLPDEVNSVSFSSDGNSILTGCLTGCTKLWDLTGKELQMFKQEEEVSSAVFLPDGKSIVTASKNGVVKHFDLFGSLIFNFNTKSVINSLSISFDGKQLFTTNNNGQINIWDLKTGKKIQTLGKLKNKLLSVASSIDGNLIASGNQDGGVELNNLSNKTSIYLEGHTSKVYSLDFSPDSRFLISASEDETTKIWNCKTGKEVASLISLDETDWVVTTPHGLFDASEGAMLHMDYEVGLEDIALEQLKERYYEPGLLEETFGLIETEYHDVPALKNIALYPELEGRIEGDLLRVKFLARSGGIGKLSFFINHKEVIEDANPSRKTEIQIDLKTYLKFYEEDTNVLTLRVYNEEGWLESHAHDFLYFPYKGSKGSENNGSNPKTITHKGKPHLYALVVGTSDYSGTNLDLRFPDLDAAAIAHGLQAVGTRLFEDRVYIRVLSTAGKIPQDISTRANIEKTLKEFAEKAGTGDVVICYFSGHGTTYGQAEKNQFYYLTKDIGSENLSDPEIRNNYTVSSGDLTKWLTAIPAHKEVVIFDACHSGKAVEALSSLGAKDLSPSQIRALDRMKDRSGIFIISGSAADAVSYEASKYGQGLLTYSLLQGMSGLSVTEDKRVDLSLLFQYALDKVPEYAKSINKIQVPIVAFPHGGGSFDIGIVDSTVKIKLAQPKPVFIRNIFLDEKNMSDHLNITHTLAEYFRQLTAQGADAELIYVDVNEYENAYSIKGLYNVTGNNINLRARVFLGANSIGEIQLTGEIGNIHGLIEKIMDKVAAFVKG